MNDIQLGRLDLNLLVTFEVLMTEGSVTRAAARLARTPSAISHSLARLREQVGDPLLVKSGSGIAPSPFAENLEAELTRGELVAIAGPGLRPIKRPLHYLYYRWSSEPSPALMIFSAWLKQELKQ